MLSRRKFLATGLGTAGLAATTGFAAELPTLRCLATDRRIGFGAAIDRTDIARPDMVALFKAHCTSLTPRNALKWMANERRPGDWDFRGVDQIVDFARSINCGVYGHTLIWYRAPAWVLVMNSAAEIRTAMRRRVTDTIRHFNGRIYAWDVVNEVMEYDAPSWRDWQLQRLLGEDYVRECFELAHEADPKAELVWNETGLDRLGAIYDGRRAMLLGLVEKLRARQVPIHSIGLQCHTRPGLDHMDPQAFGRFCAALKQMGVAVRITEMDGSCRFVSRLKMDDPSSVYADYFRDAVRIAATHGELRGVTTWGIAEKYADNEQGGNAACRSRVLLFDDELKPRPTLKALTDAFQGH
jgi:endo-1,4-beta-xylanase